MNYIRGNVKKLSKKEMYNNIVKYYTNQRKHVLDYHEVSYHSIFYIEQLLLECNHIPVKKNIKYWLLFPAYNYSIQN